MVFQPRILALLSIFLLISSAIYWSLNTNQSEEFLQLNENDEIISSQILLGRTITVVYSPTSEVVASTAHSIQESLMSFYRPVELIAIDSLKDYSGIPKSTWIIIHVYDTTPEGIELVSGLVPWDQLLKPLRSLGDIRHVMAIANAKQAMRIITNEDFVAYFPDSTMETTDAELLALYALWEVSEILENDGPNSRYKQAGADIRTVAIKYFAQNIDELVSRGFDPKVSMGKENETEKQERFNKLIDPRLGKAYWRLPSGLKAPLSSSLKEILKINYALRLGDGSSEEYTLDYLPVRSGVEGPAGEIIDLFLYTLVAAGVETIDVSPNVVRDLISAVKYIPKVLGIIEDPSVDNLLQTVLDVLIEQFPDLNKTRPYLELAVEALNALRGDTDSIYQLIIRALDVFFPDLSPQFKPLAEAIVQTGIPDLMVRLVENDNAYSEVAKWFSELILKRFVNISLVSWLNINLEEFESEFNTLISTYSFTMSVFQDKNFTRFVQLTPNLISSILPLLDATSSETVQNKILTGDQSFELDQGFISLSVLEPLFKAQKVFFWAVSKRGGVPRAQEFLKYFQIKEIIEDLLDSIYLSLNQEIPSLEPEIASFIDYIKAALNGTFYEIDAIRKTIEDYVTSFLSSVSDTSARTMFEMILSGTFELLFSIIADKDILSSAPKDIFLQFVNQMLAFFYPGLSEASHNILRSIMNLVFSGIPKMFAVLSENYALCRALLLDFSLTPQQVLEQLKQESLDYLNNVTKSILYAITGLNTTQQVILSNLTQILPSFLLTAITSSFESSSSWISFMRSLGFLAISLGLEKIKDTIGDPVFIEVDKFLRVGIGLFGPLVQKEFSIERLSLKQSVSDLLTYLQSSFQSILPSDVYNVITSLFNILPELQMFLQDGLRWLIGELTTWAKGMVNEIIDPLMDKINSVFGNLELLNLSGEFPVGIGGYNAFILEYGAELQPNVKINIDELADFVMEIIFEGNTILDSPGSTTKVFNKILSFISIRPVFRANLGVKSLDSEGSRLLKTLLATLGANLAFRGEAWFELILFNVGANGFDTNQFFKLLDWGLRFTLQLNRDITLLDFLTGGVGGGAMTKLASYIGLDAIKISVGFKIMVSIVVGGENAAKAIGGVLTVQFTISAGVSLGIDIIIAALKLYIGVEIIFTFIQNLGDLSNPLQILFTINFNLKFTVRFLFFSKTFSLDWKPSGFPINLAPSKTDPTTKEKAMGYDTDDDGLNDDYEKSLPGLSISNIDTDGDGLNDKTELKYSRTDPTIFDTDGDGLSDYEEYLELKTDPRKVDTDKDGLSDFEEVRIIGTDPLNPDTDGDRLSDYFEVSHSWNITGITPSVSSIIIGGIAYDDHTDPLVADTDNDGLLDGQEGEFGAYFGGVTYNSSTMESGTLDIIWNKGYTHPLDNDTDDDSYMQAYDGEILPSHIYFGDMRDGIEINGITATIIENGDFVTRTFYTNPVRSDSDLDTGPPEPGRIMLSDGYELYYNNPATNPLNGDSDGDGLIDGLEGFSGLSNYKTDISNPDTDGDGLNDLIEVILGYNPRSIDTDEDLITDFDEYFVYATNPLYTDSDFDGLKDGEEIYLHHCNPWMSDSDQDGIPDGEEVINYGTDPVDEDSDNDGLTDREEIMVYGTDPFNDDSDYDRLRDGEEIKQYHTNPLEADSDHDGILYPNSQGNPTFPWTDYDEIILNSSNPLKPDTDGDGIIDSLEMYLGTGEIPHVPAMALDPWSNDTDKDGLLDGYELILLNDSMIIFPYNSISVANPFNSSPVLADTDNDGVDDWTEINNGTRPDYWDTDGDLLSDYEEYYFFVGLSPRMPDSDGDGIADSLELLKEKQTRTIHNILFYHPDVDLSSIGSLSSYSLDSDLVPTYILENLGEIRPILYDTYSWASDSDGDKLPDGAEIVIYSKIWGYSPSPGKDDVNGNGIIDGYDQDLDHDNWLDGDEFYGENSTHLVSWGVFDPDSDNDGLGDGEEVHVWGTYPNNWDTDGDSYSDGFEVMVGSNPTSFTTPEEMEAILSQHKYPLVIWSPKNQTNYAEGNISVVVLNLTRLDDVWYRYKMKSDGEWSQNITLEFSSDYIPGFWLDDSVHFSKGLYKIQVFGKLSSGKVFHVESTFGVNLTASTPFYENPWFLAGVGTLGAAGAGGTGVAVIRIRKRRRRGP